MLHFNRKKAFKPALPSELQSPIMDVTNVVHTSEVRKAVTLLLHVSGKHKVGGISVIVDL